MTTPSPQQDVAAANRILAHEGVVDGYGHVSLRDPKDPQRFWLSASVSPGQVTAEDVLAFGLDGEPLLPATRALYSERAIHAALFRARPDIQAVVHGHAEETIPFSVSDVPLRPILHVAGIIGTHVPVWDIRDRFGETDLLVTTAEQADDLAACLGAGRAALLRGHGFVTAGQSLELAVRTSVYLKANARLLLQALQLGGGVRYLSDAEVQAVDARMGSPRATRRLWDNWVRRAGLPTGVAS